MIDPAYLAPGTYVDSDHPEVIAFARRVAGDAPGAREAAVKLYYAVRDDILYDPYRAYDRPDTYKASAVLTAGRGYCVGKAALLAASARVLGIPSRVAFADVRNHLATPRLLELIGTDVFIYHGITELWLAGKWIKATPTFNLTLCQKFLIKPLDFDGQGDAILHPYDQQGRDHMQYVRERGSHIDVPVDIIQPAMLAAYPRLGEALRTKSDFASEAERQVREYSIENDAFKDGDPERLLVATERVKYLAEIRTFVRWYALAAARLLAGQAGSLDIHPSHVLDDNVERAKMMTPFANEAYPEALFDRIIADYAKFLRGKSLFEVLERQFVAPRLARHNRKALLEFAAINPGPNIRGLFERVRALLEKQAPAAQAP